MITRLSVLFLLFLAELEGHRARPRLEYTYEEISEKTSRIPLPHKKVHVQLVENGTNKVIMKADQQLYSLDFVQGKLMTHHGRKCDDSPQDKSCEYEITVLQKRQGCNNQVFVCETKESKTTCSIMDLSPSSPSPSKCIDSLGSLDGISSTIKEYGLWTGEHSLFIEAPRSNVLYITQSSTENSIGIYKFGLDRVRPTTPDNAPLSRKSQYLGLVPSGTIGTQDKLYAFFKEMNTDVALESDLWLPFVAQVCMADKGGPKTKLQYQWTSQLKARLFCGDKVSRTHFPELVDVAFYHQEDGAFSKVYGLFRNEWNMSAVCVFSAGAIRHVFETSSFKGNTAEIPVPRPGSCTPFKGQHSELLRRLNFVQSHPEMDERVFPTGDPLLVSNHHYTHVRLHAVCDRSEGCHVLLYLSLESGKIHKVLERKSGGFIIAEYSPFKDRTHILDMMLQRDERKLYVSSSREVVQVDVQQCERYGERCEDCVLASDPYCGWSRTNSTCVLASLETLQDVEGGNHSVCPSRKGQNDQDEKRTVVQSRYFLPCPVTSHHAEYTWHGPGNVIMACSNTERQCNRLIDEKQGDYRCTAIELGYNKTVVLAVLKVKEKQTQSCPLPAVSIAAAGTGRHGGAGFRWVVAISLLRLAAIAVRLSTE